MPYKDFNSDASKISRNKSAKAVRDWRERTKRKLIYAMGGGCQCCNYNKCQKALELHHIDPTEKEKAFGALMAHPTAIAGWFDEFRKCVLVCANCHREIHAGMLELPETYATFDQELFEDFK